MATLTGLVKRAERLVLDNSPGILTGLAVAGTVVTAYLAGKAAFRSAAMIIDDEFHGGIADTPRQRFEERFKLTWKLYIPAVITGGVTVTCIIFANRIGSRRAAAVAAAYSLTERAFEEYRAKVVEKLGERKEQGLRDEIIQDRVTRNPPSGEVIIISGDEILCLDAYTGRYFKSSVELSKPAHARTNVPSEPAA